MSGFWRKFTAKMQASRDEYHRRLYSDQDSGQAVAVSDPPKPTPVQHKPPLTDYIGQPVDKLANAARHDQLVAMREDCLPAERDSLDKQIALVTNRDGRVIDINAILSLRDKNGQWIWTVANPEFSVGWINGSRVNDGRCLIQYRKLDASDHNFITSGVYIGCHEIELTNPPSAGSTRYRQEPKGFPALPARVRELYRQHKNKTDIESIGVLYQPDEWEVKPEPVDPALVVKYRNDPKWYALAIWGHDGPAIMEFVD